MASEQSSSEIRVRYQETDQMGFAWHGNYIAWFEVGRTDWWRAKGMSYQAMEAEGYRLPVLRVACEYKQSAFYDDVLRIQTRLLSYNGLRLCFSYTITRVSDHVLIAIGETEHIFIDRERNPLRAAKRLPEIHQLLVGVEFPGK